MAISIPAFCPECGLIFKSGISLGGKGSAQMEGCKAICPNGHWGMIANGTYKILDGILRISQGDYGTAESLREILAIAHEAEYGLRGSDSALEDIASLLPPEAAAAIKQLGRKHPMTAILLIVAIVGMFAGAVANIAQAVRSVFPSAPAPQIIIHNHNAIINPSAPSDGGSHTFPAPSKNGRSSKQKQMKKEQKKAPRKGYSEPTYKIEC